MERYSKCRKTGISGTQLIVDQRLTQPPFADAIWRVSCAGE